LRPKDQMRDKDPLSLEAKIVVTFGLEVMSEMFFTSPDVTQINVAARTDILQ